MARIENTAPGQREVWLSSGAVLVFPRCSPAMGDNAQKNSSVEISESVLAEIRKNAFFQGLIANGDLILLEEAIKAPEMPKAELGSGKVTDDTGSHQPDPDKQRKRFP